MRADVPEPGDVSTVEVGKASIMIVRDDDENIRTYRNVCRHRGSRIMQQAGKAQNQDLKDIEGQ